MKSDFYSFEMMIFGLMIAIFLGLIFGSFGSVILSRRGESDTLKQASSILWGRSACPHCKTTLQARDLVPLLSFVFQKREVPLLQKKDFLAVSDFGARIGIDFCRNLAIHRRSRAGRGALLDNECVDALADDCLRCSLVWNSSSFALGG